MSHKLHSTPKLMRPSLCYHHSSRCCGSPSQLPWRARAGFHRGRVASLSLSQHRETSQQHSHTPVNQMCMFPGCWRNSPALQPEFFFFNQKSHHEAKLVTVGLRNGFHRCRTAQTTPSALHNRHILQLCRVKRLAQPCVLLSGVKTRKISPSFPAFLSI